MEKLINRAKHVVGGEEGMSNIELIVWIVVVLVIAVALFAFRDKISDFLGTSTGKVADMDSKISQTNP